MTELPKIVKSRLRQAQGGDAVSHPAAELLAAFSEQAVTPAERESVLAHLSVCTECREVVALSLPPETAKQGGYVPRGLFGLRPDFFRWGIVAASAAVVVAAVLLVRPEFEKPSSSGLAIREEVARQTPAPATSAESDAAKAYTAVSKDAAAKPSVSSARAKAVEEPTLALGRVSLAAPPPPPPAALSSNSMGGGTKNTLNTVVKGGVSSAVAPPSERGRTEALQGAVRNGPVTRAPQQANGVAAAKREDGYYAFNAKEARDESALADASTLQPGSDTKASSGAAGKDEMKVLASDAAKSAPATAEFSAVARKQKLDRVAPAVAKLAESAARTWRITEGKLEWSLDAGKSWQRVDAPGGARFLSVDSRRANVWAGGTSGVVIRSVDNGSTWVPVTTGWTGDVVYLKFDDEKHGTLKTSTGEEWFTDDGGASWKKK